MKHIYLTTTLVLSAITVVLMSIGLRPVRHETRTPSAIVAQAHKTNLGV